MLLFVVSSSTDQTSIPYKKTRNRGKALPLAALLLSTLLIGCSGSSPAAPAPTPSLSLSASSLTFSGVYGQSVATQYLTLTNTGKVASPLASLTVSAPFTTTATAASCGTLAPAASCTIPVAYSTGAVGTQSGNLVATYETSSLTAALSGTVRASTYTLSAAGLSFSTRAGSRAVTLTNTVSGAAVAVSSVTISGANSAAFKIADSNCTGDITATCSVSVAFNPAAAGAQSASLVFNTNGTGSPTTVPLTGALTTEACDAGSSATSNFCSAFKIKNDTYQWSGYDTYKTNVVGIAGYADPSIRKEPNSSNVFLAYAISTPFANGTQGAAMNSLHLAHSLDGGQTFTLDGAVLDPTASTQTQSAAYASSNLSSHNTPDLLPIAQTGSTLWVQAHQEVLVPASALAGTEMSQAGPTSYISVSALNVPLSDAATEGAALLKIGTVPDSRLGAVTTDPTISLTQRLSSLSPAASSCSYFQEPALWYSNQILYLALQCVEPAGAADVHQMAHLLFTSSMTGADASAWTWNYVGEFGTAADAVSLAKTESLDYAFFTGAQFTQLANGSLALVASPTSSITRSSGAGSSGAAQISAAGSSAIGCRVLPLSSLTAPAFVTDPATGSATVAGRVDFNTSTVRNNSCSYDSGAALGIIAGEFVVNRIDLNLGEYGNQLVSTDVKP